MNYPIWDLPAAGLLIAGIAILHVFISHFAVGGGLLLVWLETRARRTHDDAMLDYARRHTRFFVLLTLVLGALTGVAIWVTIGLIHPQGTSTLIQAFVWGWAIEWVFFAVEIAAALIYYYGWDRMEARTHLTVGWIYFISAWMSLVVINGILSFMLTPGRWIVTGNFWDGILNPTYFPSLLARTVGALGLAGAYALLTLAWTRDRELQSRLVRPLALGWVLPAVAGLFLSLVWVMGAASGAGIDVAGILGASGGGLREAIGAIFSSPATGHPVVRTAARVALNGMMVAALVALLVAWSRGPRVTRTAAVALMAGSLAVVGGLEWVREGLRKPYIIGNYMLLSGVRVTGPPPFTTFDLQERGALQAARWVPHPAPLDDEVLQDDRTGREVFRLQCAQCHTVDGYLAIRPLVRGAGPNTIARVIDRLPEWRGRRMPPFAGTAGERRALAAHLALVGGATTDEVRLARRPAATGAQVFADHCGMCHGSDGVPIDPAGRTAAQFHDLIGRLPDVSDAMPAFEGSEAEREALAEHLAGESGSAEGGAR
jgi:cytochrome bd-type quinol oxidase subunit 1/mono/diheme cytochrome c family protein